MIDNRQEQIRLLARQLKIPTVANYNDTIRQCPPLTGTVKSYAQIGQRHNRNWLGEGRTDLWDVRLGCRSAGCQLFVKGGEATCEALDGQLAVCHLRQVTVICSVFFPIHLLQ